MHQAQPERLWKYREWNENSQRMITDGEFYFASVKELNDPFEFRWRETIPSKPEEIDLFVRELCAKAYPKDSIAQRRIHFARLKREMFTSAAISNGRPMPTLARFDHGVFCASEVYDDILMWSHYAKNHTGVCVSFRLDRFGRKKFLPVEYAETVPHINAWEYIRSSDRSVFTKLGLTKSTHWRYENEWRTIDIIGKKFYPKCVDRIIVGAMASDETVAAVRECIAKAGYEIKLLFARRSASRYGLEVREGFAKKQDSDDLWQQMIERNEATRKAAQRRL